jgi:hypothetical protein
MLSSFKCWILSSIWEAYFFLMTFRNFSHSLGGITPFSVFSDAFPGLKMWDTFTCATAIFLILSLNLNCSARERAPWRRVIEKNHFSARNVGLAGTGNRTQANCLAGSVARRSAIHYAMYLYNISRIVYSGVITYNRAIVHYNIVSTSSGKA